MNSFLTVILPTHAAIAAAAACSHMSACEMPAHMAKYIIVERDGRELPLLFPFELQHSDMLSVKSGRAVSAGFYQIVSADLILVKGHSSTLNLNSRPQDASIIKRHLLSVPSVP